MPSINLTAPKDKRTLMIIGVAAAVLAFVLAYPIAYLVSLLGVNDVMVRPVIRSVTGAGFMIALGAMSWLRFDTRKIRDAWHFSRPLVMINLIIGTLIGGWAVMLLFAAGGYSGGEVISLLKTTVLCIFVGINEEIIFRGLLFGGLLAGLGSRKGGPLLAAVISSAVFGFAHVMTSIDITNLLVIAQALLKTLSGGMFGLILCVSVLEGRNLVGAITVHTFFDWAVMIVLAANGTTPSGEYVNTDPTIGLVAIVVYLVMTVLYLPTTIKAFRRLSAVKLPQFGPFVPAEESAKLANTAWQDEREYQAHRSDGDVDAPIGNLRDHKVFNHRHLTILGTLICFLMLNTIVSALVMALLGTGTAAKIVISVAQALIGLAMLAGFQSYFGSHFDGVTAWSTAGLIIAAPCAALGVISLFGWAGTSLNNPLVCLVLALASGVTEEIIFRAIPCSNWMRVGSSRRDVISCIAFTTVAFTLAYLGNVSLDAGVAGILLQILYALSMGAVLAVALLASGSIWPSVFLHAVVEFLALMPGSTNPLAPAAPKLATGPLITAASVIVCVTLLGWVVYQLMGTRQEEIEALWKRKWRKG